MLARVECKLRCGEVIAPVRLTLVGKHPKVLFDISVFALDFAIALRVIGSSQTSFDTETLVERAHKPGGKLWAAVREYFLRDAVKLEDVLVVEFGSAFSGQIGLAGDEVCLIGVVVNVDADRVEAVGRGKLCDKINANMFPGSSRDFLRFEDSTRV